MTQMHPILARFHDEVAMVAAGSQVLFTSLLTQLVASEQLAQAMEHAATQDGFWPASDSWLARFRPYNVVDGILQIPVKGVLLNDFPYQFGPYATGYEYIQRAFERGVEDFAAGNIKGIAFVINSPGGMVAGCFTAAQKALDLKAESGVPVRSYAAEHAYSAAYVWACVGDTITVTRTGGVGSIGVVTMHVDYSGMLEQAGIKVTFITFGKHKADGNAYEALPDDVKARIQAKIDDLGGIFVAHVAANRPLSEEAVRATEALTYTAPEAKSNGLADEIGALDDALAVFAADLSNPPDDDEGDDEMSDPKDNSAAPAATETQTETVDAARVAADAVAADRARRKAIMGCDEAKDRPALAAHFADDTDMTPEQAQAALAVAGKETAPAAAEAPTPFGAQMDAEDHPNVGASTGASNDDDEDSAEGVVALVGRLGLKGFGASAR